MPSSKGSSPPRDLMSPALAAFLPLIPPGKPYIVDGGGGGVVTKSCPTLVTGVRVSLLVSSAQWDFSGKYTRVGHHLLLRIVDTQQLFSEGMNGFR